jgi:hypothetical protein
MVNVPPKEDEPDWARLVPWISRLEDAMSRDDDSTTRTGVIYGFMEELYNARIVYSFDWSAWQHEAERLYEDRAALKAASLSDLRKLLTTHARKDRFCEGHFEAAFDSGHLVGVLREVAKRLAAQRGQAG